MNVLELTAVSKTFSRGGRTVAAVQQASLHVGASETVAVVGESGSGKSTLGRLALLLLRPDEGDVLFEGGSLLALGSRELRRARARIQVVFQEPFESLDPQLTAARSVEEPLLALRPQPSAGERAERVAEALEMVGLDPAKGERYPAQLSGGEQQRVGIARSIITRPALVVLDEPTSSLDLTVRAGVLALLSRLQEQLRMSYLFVSHDLDTVEHFAHRTYVMYRGRVVESGPSHEVMRTPAHPYTALLRAARLSVDHRVRPETLPVGRPELVGATDDGCPFRGRCPSATDRCGQAPPLVELRPGVQVACWHPLPLAVR